MYREKMCLLFIHNLGIRVFSIILYMIDNFICRCHLTFIFWRTYTNNESQSYLTTIYYYLIDMNKINYKISNKFKAINTIYILVYYIDVHIYYNTCHMCFKRITHYKYILYKREEIMI